MRYDFRGAGNPAHLPHPWRPKLVGSASARLTGGALQLATRASAARAYQNAQVDDYQGLPRSAFPWSPPLTFTVRARFSHEPAATSRGPGLLGSAGFGFWNDPFMMTDPRPPALPRVAWFLYASPPSEMWLSVDVPPYGWKAQVIDALRPAALPWAIAAPALLLLFRSRRVYRSLWPAVQRALHISETVVPAAMTTWHTYTIMWQRKSVAFGIDDRLLLQWPFAPRGPLGLVIWKDNQYMIVTPTGRLGHGVVPIDEEQWLELESVEIRPG
jgi:hypothetical protein